MKSLRILDQYKSLSPFQWTDIPQLAILTGLNGVGKTQLLKLIAASSGVADLGGLSIFAAPPIEVEPKLKCVGYLPALWKLTDVQVAHEFFEPVNKLTWFIENQARARIAPSDLLPAMLRQIEELSLEDRPAVTRVIETLSSRGQLRSPISRADVLAALNPYHLVKSDSAQPLSALAQIFYAYVNEQFAAIRQGVPDNEIEMRLGRPPWELADELLQRFEMSFRLTTPDDLRFDYELLCRFPESRDIVRPSELSSGEQAVLALVALVVTTSVLGAALDDMGQETELLLLDEPDAHLNTSKVKSYLEHLQQLTQRSLRIIMITHRPDTIALAPDDSLFEMHRVNGTTSITKVTSKAEAIGRLAADTVAVLPGVRVVLVEDEDDRRFHQWAYERALKHKHLPENPRLVFMPVVAKGGGGKDAVIQRLTALRREGLGAVHRGLVDGDNVVGPEPPGVVRLDRYTLENYLADPIALYCAVVDNKSSDTKLQFSRIGGITRSDLHTLRSAAPDTLQRIADLVLASLEQVSTLLDGTRREVTLHGDPGSVALQYPSWLFTTTKKELWAAIQQAFGPGVLSEEHLHGGPEVACLLPDDLVATYRRLVTDRS